MHFFECSCWCFLLQVSARRPWQMVTKDFRWCGIRIPALQDSLNPSLESFRQGVFYEYEMDGKLRVSSPLRNGRFEERYKPYGSVEVELTGFHLVDGADAITAVAEYHKISIGGSSSNDCFVNVVRFAKAAKPKMTQQIVFGCDSNGSGSIVSSGGRELTIRQGVKSDRVLAVAEYKWDGTKFELIRHGSEPLHPEH